jgi:uncharacterized membrane protein
MKHKPPNRAAAEKAPSAQALATAPGGAPPQDTARSEAAKSSRRTWLDLKNGSNEKSVIARLAEPEADKSRHIGAKLRNYLLTGLVIVGPVSITRYATQWVIRAIDDWVKPFLPKSYNPDTYLPIAIPGMGLLLAIAGITLIGALAANLLGRTLFSYGDLFLGRMPIVRNVYRALKQIFESVVTAAGPGTNFKKVGLIEFPSKGLWSIVFITGDTLGEIGSVKPGGHDDLITVFMATGIVPPTGFVCFVPRDSVMLLDMSVEDAAKVVISAGMVTPPDPQKQLAALAAAAQATDAAGMADRGTAEQGIAAHGNGQKVTPL